MPIIGGITFDIMGVNLKEARHAYRTVSRPGHSGIGILKDAWRPAPIMIPFIANLPDQTTAERRKQDCRRLVGQESVEILDQFSRVWSGVVVCDADGEFIKLATGEYQLNMDITVVLNSGAPDDA